MGRSFEDAFEAEFAPMHRYLARRLGGSAADDLAAETFAVAFRNWERLDPERPVRPWLYEIAANLVRHHWRKERRMLRAYARTGVDPVLEDAAVERADAQRSSVSLQKRSPHWGATSARSSSCMPGRFRRGNDAQPALRRCSPPAKGPSQGRAAIIEAYDSSGSPVIVAAWGPGSLFGAVYARPDVFCDTPLIGSLPAGRCDSGAGNG